MLEARIAELGDRYTDEEVAATAFYLGAVSLSSIQMVMPLVFDTHYMMHVMASLYAGEWLVEFIQSGSVDPEKMHEYVRDNHPELLEQVFDVAEGEGEQDPDESANIRPMDNDTFTRLWGSGGRGADEQVTYDG